MRPRGFSLLEVFFSCTLVALVFLTVAELYPLSSASLIRGKRLATAASVAQDTIEKLRLTPFSELSAGRSTQTFDGREYEVVVRLTPVSPKVQTATITVSCAGTAVTYSTGLYDYVNAP